jgi:hypothetical protein
MAEAMTGFAMVFMVFLLSLLRFKTWGEAVLPSAGTGVKGLTAVEKQEGNRQTAATDRRPFLNPDLISRPCL